MERQTSGMAAAKRHYGKSDLRVGTDCGGSAGDRKKTGRTECSDKTKRTDVDGLSGADHEIYTSGSGRDDCKKGIPENFSGLWKKEKSYNYFRYKKGFP